MQVIQDPLGIIPDQYTGEEIQSDASTTGESDQEIEMIYGTASERLLAVNAWHDIAGTLSARFQVHDKNGIAVQRTVTKGDYLRIDIPGPGSAEGDGFDWVIVEELKEINTEELKCIGFRVRPTASPLAGEKRIAHFYDPSATSTFMITCSGKTVSASITDRNLRPNKQSAGADKIRATAVGLSAISLFSKIQWQQLANALIKTMKL